MLTKRSSTFKRKSPWPGQLSWGLDIKLTRNARFRACEQRKAFASNRPEGPGETPGLFFWSISLRSFCYFIYCYCVPRIGGGICGCHSACVAIKTQLCGVISTPRVAVPRRSERSTHACRKPRGQSDAGPGLVAKVCITDMKEAEAGGLRVQGLPGLLSELKANIGN